ncbi:MAG: ATP-binding protein, partial [Thermoguttaceae bacterium]|nr:ATP-binding protein [Thermoguttaceae bacterium]
PRCLDDILGYDRRRFDQLEAEFLTIFPEFASIKLEPCPAYQSAPNFVGRDIPSLQKAEGKRVGFELKESGAVLPASQASDGVLIVLAYLAVMHLPKPPALILIEEPENGIHPKRLQEIVRILRTLIEKNGRTQILMTSHSPYLLDEFRPDEVTLCRKDAHGAVQTRRLSQVEHVRSQLNVFSLGEIWTGEGDDRLAGATPAAEAT